MEEHNAVEKHWDEQHAEEQDKYEHSRGYEEGQVEQVDKGEKGEDKSDEDRE